MHVKSCCFSLLGRNSHTAGVGECCYTAISRNVVGKNLHAQSRMLIWIMINTLFLTLKLSNLLLLLPFTIRKHTSMASRVILSNSFEK